MKTRMIGSLEVSVVGLGTNTFGTDSFSNPCDQEGATAVVNAALEAGVTFFDTAEEYSITTLSLGTGHSEQFLRAALGKRRDDVVIASKFLPRLDTAPDEWGATRIVRAVEGSLTRLGTDRIDLYQQRRPILRLRSTRSWKHSAVSCETGRCERSAAPTSAAR